MLHSRLTWVSLAKASSASSPSLPGGTACPGSVRLHQELWLPHSDHHPSGPSSSPKPSSPLPFLFLFYFKKCPSFCLRSPFHCFLTHHLSPNSQGRWFQLLLCFLCSRCFCVNVPISCPCPLHILPVNQVHQLLPRAPSMPSISQARKPGVQKLALGKSHPYL